MPTNEQRRATAKRKLERQLERRAKQAKRRRILVIAAGSILAVAVIAAVVIAVVNTKHEHKSNTAATTTTHQQPPGDHSAYDSADGSRSAVAAVQTVGQPGRQLPVPGVAGTGRQVRSSRRGPARCRPIRPR